MRPGPKGDSPAAQRAKGETRPSRKVVAIFPTVADRPDPEDIPAPKGMSAAAKKIWAEKVERYRQRGQKVQGLESSLRSFCELEAALNKAYGMGAATMAMVNAHRLWSAEFYDTPAAQKASMGGGKAKENSFARNGVRASAGG
ncbi:MAG: hypothetical protein ACYDD1_11380 [Caulobacteraceae bacterium]